MRTRVAAALAVLSLSACSGEKPVSPDALPAAVAKAVAERFPGAKVGRASRETEKGRVLYDVELAQNGRHFEVELDASGGIVQIEAPIAPHELPDAAARAIEQRYPNEQLREIERKTEVVGGQEKVASYEIRLVTAEKKAVEVEVTPDGRILGEEPDEKK